jgi:hypothetical protein
VVNRIENVRVVPSSLFQGLYVVRAYLVRTGDGPNHERQQAFKVSEYIA